SLLNLDSSELFLAPEHAATEKMLAESGIAHANLRNGWYWENYAAALETGKAMGKFFSAAGEAKVSGAARQDFAEAAAVVVTTVGHAGKHYELAGAPAYTYSDIAARVGVVLVTEVECISFTVAEYEKSLPDAGLTAELATCLAGAHPVRQKSAP